MGLPALVITQPRPLTSPLVVFQVVLLWLFWVVPSSVSCISSLRLQTWEKENPSKLCSSEETLWYQMAAEHLSAVLQARRQYTQLWYYLLG